MKLAPIAKLLKLWKRTYKYFLLTILCLMLVVSRVLVASSVDKISEKARKAESFVNSIGINTHLYYGDTVYHQKYHEIIKPRLLELGVHHIRDGGTRNLNGYLDRLQELRNLGIRTTLIFDPRGGTPQEGVQLIKDLGNVVEAVEGPNEYDLSDDDNWVNTLRDYVQQLYQLVKSDPETQNLPVLGPSLTSKEAYSTVGNLNDYIDYSVLHNYFSGRHPGNNGWGNNGYGSIPYAIGLALKSSASKPIMTTETGYHNAINTQEGHAAIPESIAEKYMPRLFLEQFNHGIERTFGYELIDLQNDLQRNISGLNFGLLRNDGSIKPAFTNLRNLVSLLKEEEATQFTPGILKYSLKGITADIHHTLLQKSDGRFYLILWQEKSGFDLNTKQAITVPHQQIKLALGQKFAKADLYLLRNSLKPVQHFANPQEIILEIPDTLLIVELSS